MSIQDFPLPQRTQLFALAAIAALILVVSGVYWPTVSQLLGLGRTQDQATDAALVVLVALVLIWNARARLSSLPIQPCFWGLIPLLCSGFVWLCGELIFARIFTQFAVLATFPAALLTIFGFQWARVLAFPCFVLFFALPVWVVLVPLLVKMSAFVAEIAIKASGVPIYRDGAYFILPTGSWSIADACSGVAFFSTSLLLGLLYAWTIFESNKKRILFVAGAAAIGVAGNWVRVYLTIMVAHLSDNRYLRDDHYMFGWYLFAVFLFGYFYVGWRHRDGVPDASGHGAALSMGDQPKPFVSNMRSLALAIPACIVAIAVWPKVHDMLADRVGVTAPRIDTVAAAAGWTEAARDAREWKPELRNATFVREQTFVKDGRRVTLYFGVYQNETWERKLVSVANQLAGGDGSKWSLADRGQARSKIGETDVSLRTGVIVGNGIRILAWHWYWINGEQTSSDLFAKFKQLLVRLGGHEPLSVWVTISTDAEQSSDEAARALSRFLADMSEPILKSLAGSGQVTRRSN